MNRIWAFIIETLLLSAQNIPQKLGNKGPIFRLLVQTPRHDLPQFHVDVLELGGLKSPSMCRLVCFIMVNSFVRKPAEFSRNDGLHLSITLAFFSSQF